MKAYKCHPEFSLRLNNFPYPHMFLCMYTSSIFVLIFTFFIFFFNSHENEEKRKEKKTFPSKAQREKK